MKVLAIYFLFLYVIQLSKGCPSPPPPKPCQPQPYCEMKRSQSFIAKWVFHMV